MKPRNPKRFITKYYRRDTACRVRFFNFYRTAIGWFPLVPWGHLLLSRVTKVSKNTLCCGTFRTKQNCRSKEYKPFLRVSFSAHFFRNPSVSTIDNFAVLLLYARVIGYFIDSFKGKFINESACEQCNRSESIVCFILLPFLRLCSRHSSTAIISFSGNA